MTDKTVEPRLDQALAALLRMRIEEIDETEARIRNLSIHDASQIPALKQIRSAALQAGRLWHACLPQNGRIYTADGLVAETPGVDGLSVSG